jgi:carotenoid cleavage dioxygenase-like enzyme
MVADVPVTPQPGEGGAAPAPSYNHQSLAFTPSFLLLPEMPLRMPADGSFDWDQIQDSWLPNGTLYFRVLDKAARPLGRYALNLGGTLGAHKFTWHNVNAWENATHVTLDTQLQTIDALNGFTGAINITAWESVVVRVTMPNPTADGAPAEGAAELRLLSGGADVSSEFGAVNPAVMWKGPARYIWAASTDAAHHPYPWFPHVARIDTDAEAGNGVLRWSPGLDWMMAPPLFIPLDAKQPADSAAGAVIVYAVDLRGQSAVFVLDGESHTLAAQLSLPVAPLPSMGLHNHFSGYPSST